MSPLIENLDRMVQGIPTMPVVAQKVMQMLGDPRTNNAALGETLSSDQSMASRVLRMANSPFFGTRRKIGSISNAIFILGHSALRSLIITACTKGLYANPRLMEQKLWEQKAVLEVRSYEVPFVIEEGQIVGRLAYERLTVQPERLYGEQVSSNYQRQGLRLSKHFKQPQCA